MPMEKARDYESLKAAILQAYELTPEAYRMKFRSWTKQEKQTRVEFSRDQTVWFDKWVNAMDCKDDYDRLREMILIEQFKNRVGEPIQVYLNERKLTTLHETAVCADGYVLIHKGSKSKSDDRHFRSKDNRDTNKNTNTEGPQSQKSGQGSSVKISSSSSSSK